MKKLAAALVAAVALVALSALSGVALAGDHGNGNGNGNNSTASSDQQAGVKPSNDTKKDQTCTTGGGQGSSATCSSSTYPGKSDSSKRYGNGKTAAQIANGKGAPSGTPVYGPGNSQPHKICGRDVHAYKGGDCSKQKPAKTQTTTTTSTATTTTTGSEQGKEHGKVYICHATGSATNPYVLIRVSVNALPAHTRHQDGRDIVLGDTPGPCPGPAPSVTTTATTTAVTTAAATTTTVATTTTAAATTTTTAAAAALGTNTPTPPPSQSAPAAQSSPGGVLGATKALSTPSHAHAGVLGTLKTLGTGTLPFTGLRLWIFGVIALGLIGAGLAMRLVAGRRTN